MPQNKGPSPFPQEKEMAAGLSMCHITHMLKHNIEHTSSLNQGEIPTQGDKPSVGCQDAFSC